MPASYLGYFSTKTALATAHPASSEVAGTLADTGDSGLLRSNTLVWAPISVSLVTPHLFGAYGDGTHDDTAAVQAAASTGQCLIPAGFNFLVSSTITIPNGATFVGQGSSSIITGNSVSGAVIATASSSPGTQYASIGNFQIAGSGTNACNFTNTYDGNEIYDIWVNGGTWVDVFFFALFFGNVVRNLVVQPTVGAILITKSCFHMDGAVNSNTFTGLYTNSTYNPYAFYCQDDGGYGGSGANTFNSPTAQGSVIGLFIGYNWGAQTFNSFYFENVVQSITIGSYSGITSVDTITGSGTPGGPYYCVPLKGGTGHGATATITMSGTTIASITPNGHLTGGSSSAQNGSGNGYAVGDRLTFSFGGAIVTTGTYAGGSGTNGTYPYIPLQGGSGFGAWATVTVTSGSVSNVDCTFPNGYGGNGYIVGDTLSFILPGETALTCSCRVAHVGPFDVSGTCNVVTVNSSANNTPVNLTFNSPLTGAPLTTHPSYEARTSVIDLVLCAGVIINSPTLTWYAPDAQVKAYIGAGVIAADLGYNSGTITTGTYSNVALLGGSGAGAVVDISSTGGSSFSASSLVNAGGGYAVNDILHFSCTGGTGSFKVTGVTAGTGALAVALISTRGIVAQVVVYSGGSGFTGTQSVGIGGWSGSGVVAMVTAAVSGGAIVTGSTQSISISNAGAGYIPGLLGPPVSFGNAQNCCINFPALKTATFGQNAALYPWIAVDPFPFSVGGCGVNIIGDNLVEYLSGIGSGATLQKCAGYNNSHCLSWFSASIPPAAEVAYIVPFLYV